MKGDYGIVGKIYFRIIETINPLLAQLPNKSRLTATSREKRKLPSKIPQTQNDRMIKRWAAALTSDSVEVGFPPAKALDILLVYFGVHLGITVFEILAEAWLKYQNNVIRKFSNIIIFTSM